MTKYLLLTALALTVSASSTQASIHNISISYSDAGYGVSGSGIVHANDVGGGEFLALDGYLDVIMPGFGSIHETLVFSPSNPSVAVFSNTNGDNLTYDNRIFIPAGGPDGAFFTYAGGLVFQTSSPSDRDVYLSAYYQGANNPTVFYFAGYPRAYGALSDIQVTDLGVNNVPEPATFAMTAMGACGLLGYSLRRRKVSV